MALGPNEKISTMVVLQVHVNVLHVGVEGDINSKFGTYIDHQNHDLFDISTGNIYIDRSLPADCHTI